MKRILLLTFITLSFLANSQRTPQDRAEISVQNYIKKAFKNQTYKAYNFGELYKTTPSEIMEIESIKNKIDSLRKENKLTYSELNKYDSIILFKTKEVKQKKRYSTYDINHYFVIEKSNSVNILYQYNFTLYPNGKVKEIQKLLEREFVSDEYDWFYHYYRRNIIISEINENKNIYNYLDELLEAETIDKNECMSTVLTMIKTLYNKQYLDTISVSTAVVKKWFLANKSLINILKTSNLKPIKENNLVIGYKVFVKFEENNETKTLYFELDTDYITRGVLEVEKPFNKYFE